MSEVGRLLTSSDFWLGFACAASFYSLFFMWGKVCGIKATGRMMRGL